MSDRIRLAIILLTATLVVGFMGTYSQVTADGSEGFQVHGLSQRDMDGNGQPDITIIDAAFSSDRDSVTVLDGGRDMAVSTDWRQATDFENDTWIFDAKADGSIELIIVFSKEGDQLVASMYDDQNRDGKVSYRYRDNRLDITESRYPTVKVIAQDGWWTREQVINYNITVLIDGVVLASEDKAGLLSWLANDGYTDYEIQVRDRDLDGSPDFELIKVPFLDNRSGAATRTYIRTSVGHKNPLEGFIFWPYMSSLPTRSLDPYKDRVAPIWIDWSSARVIQVVEFVPSRYGEHNFFIKSIPKLEGSPAYMNLENPFAFYDLADDQDGYPELQVRVGYFGPNDPMFPDDLQLGGRFPKPFTTIRYSWDQDNNGSWDYKVGMIGRYLIDSVVDFPDLSVKTIPYDEVPYWATEKMWDVATLIEAPPGGFVSSEGIYTGDPSADLFTYVAGFITDAPKGECSDFSPGYRGDCSLNYRSQSYMYLSPVDGKLHLLGAEKGVWNLDGQRKIYYENLDKDEHIDKWTLGDSWDNREKGVDDTQVLIAAKDHLIYSGEGEVILLRTQFPPELFRALPPRNHQEWLEIGALLKENQRSLDPSDFKSMLAQFQGESLHIKGAALRDVHLTDKGFSGVLNLSSGFTMDSQLPINTDEAMIPGEYILAMEGAITVNRLESPSLRLKTTDIALSPASPQQLDYVDLSVALTNRGLGEAKNVVVAFYAGHESETHELVGVKSASLSSGEEKSFSVTWVPDRLGTWELKVEVHTPYSVDHREIIANAEIRPDEGTDLITLLTLTSQGWWPMAAGGLLLLMATAAVAGLFVLIGIEPMEDARS